jgi:hypothetical protein
VSWVRFHGRRPRRCPRGAKLVNPFWHDFVPASCFDPRKTLPRFETTDSATQERWTRIELQRKGAREDRALAEFMADFADGVPANLTCCSLTTMGFRIWCISEQLRIFEPFETMFMMHLLFPEEAVPFGELEALHWPTLRARLWRRIERSISPRAIVAGGLEVDANADARVWTPHAHLAIANASRSEIECLRESYFGSEHGPDLMVVDQIRDRPRQFAYPIKLVVYRRPFPQKGNSPEKGVRLRPPEHLEFLRYLARHTPMELVFLFNVRRAGRRLKINGRAHY